MTDNDNLRDTDSDPTSRLSDVVRQKLLAAVGSATVPFLEMIDGVVPAPAAGQYWRARWDGVSTAILVLAFLDHDRVQAAAVTFDTDLAEQTARVAPAAVTTMGVDTVLWLADAVELPLSVLDRYLGSVDASTPDSSRLTAFVADHTVPGPVRDLTEQPAGLRASLKDDLAALTGANWLTDAEPEGGVNLDGLKASRIAEALNMPLNEALQIKRGARVLTLEQAQALADIAEPTAPASGRERPPLPDIVLSLFNRPDVRASVVELAARRNKDENAVRRDTAYEMAFGVAARATGDMADDEAERQMWRQRIQQYFEVHLGEAEQ